MTSLKRWLVFSSCLIASWVLLGYLGWALGMRNLEIAVIGGACFVVLRFIWRRAVDVDDRAAREARAKRIAESMPQTLDDYNQRRQFNASQVTNGRKHA